MPDTDKAVDDWVNQTLRGGPLPRHTEAWNAILEALPDLKRRLKGDDDKPAEGDQE